MEEEGELKKELQKEEEELRGMQEEEECVKSAK